MTTVTVSKGLKKAMTAIRLTKGGRRRAYRRFFDGMQEAVAERAAALHQEWFSKHAALLEAYYLTLVPKPVKVAFAKATMQDYMRSTTTMRVDLVECGLDAYTVSRMRMGAEARDRHADKPRSPFAGKTVSVTGYHGVQLSWDTTQLLPVSAKLEYGREVSVRWPDMPAKLQAIVRDFCAALAAAYNMEATEAAKRVLMGNTLWSVYERWPELAEAYCRANGITMPTEDSVKCEAALASGMKVPSGKALALGTSLPSAAVIKQIAATAGLPCSNPVTVKEG